jgi:hypothetical protein
LIQDNAEDMRAGISAMDAIYEQSLFTIIACAGVDAQHGLPGVRSGSRKASQVIHDILPGIQLLVSHEMETLIKRTQYSQRAWT